MEQHRFCGQARAECHGATGACGSAVLRSFHDFSENEEHCRRGHVAVVVEDMTGRCEVSMVESERLFHGVEDRSSTGMHGPQVDGILVAPARMVFRFFSSSARERAPGTFPDNTMSKPMSPMRQVISSEVSGTMTALNESRAMPSSSADTSTAADPSPNTRNDSIVSSDSDRCR